MSGCDSIIGGFADELGPAKTIHIYDPATGLKAIVVIDNVARGPAIGGVRIAADLSTEEVFRLARAMTLKNAVADLPHGGAKAGIIADPHGIDKESCFRVFARQIRQLEDYIPGPDMGSDERCMGYIADEIGRCVGIPRVLGGIPLDEIGATGYGLSQAARVAAPHAGLSFSGATLAIQGFGNVGKHAALFLARQGVRLVAASDSTGAVFAGGGLDIEALIRAKKKEGSVLAYPGGERIPKEDLFGVPCDILIPAARPDAITMDNVESVRARVILQGANIPVTEEAELRLHERGVLCIPDIIANAGGVICGAVELAGGRERQSFSAIREKIGRNTGQLLSIASERKLPPRQAALQMAFERIRGAMAFRR